MDGANGAREWIDHLFPDPVVDLADVKQRLTDHPQIQAWLPDASLRAAGGLESMDAAGIGLYAYGNLMSDFRRTFPGLAEAVNDATAGCGRVVVNWRPTDPQYSTVSIEFGSEHEMLLMLRCTAGRCRADDLAAFLNRLSDKLPRGTPFPRRPDQASGVISTPDGCVFVQLVVENTGREVRRFANIRLPGEERPLKIPANAVMSRLQEVLEVSDRQ